MDEPKAEELDAFGTEEACAEEPDDKLEGVGEPDTSVEKGASPKKNVEEAAEEDAEGSEAVSSGGVEDSGEVVAPSEEGHTSNVASEAAMPSEGINADSSAAEDTSCGNEDDPRVGDEPEDAGEAACDANEDVGKQGRPLEKDAKK